MPISLTPSLAETSEGREKIPPGTLAYFRARLRNRLHQLVLREFVKRESAATFSRARLSRRIDRKKEQVTRWLGAPGNWTLDTLSDLLIGMGLELVIDAAAPAAFRSPQLVIVPPPQKPISPELPYNTPRRRKLGEAAEDRQGRRARERPAQPRPPTPAELCG